MAIILSIVTDDVSPMLDELRAKMENMGPLVQEIGQLWSDQMAFNFAAADWAPLAASTVAYKMAHDYPLAPLFRTQAMRDAAVASNWELLGDKAVRMLPNYAGFHIEGAPGSFMPARDFTFLESGFEVQVGEAAYGFFGG